MFALTEDDLGLRILGCADGPSSFNSEATKRGADVISVDPIYAFSRAEIESRIEATYLEIVEQTRQNLSTFVWQRFKSVEELGRARMQAMRRFLADYNEGRESGRYLATGLPSLPFLEQQFDLALCSHFLFLYTQQLGEAFHVDSVIEMCCLAREVRIFPLLGMGGEQSLFVAMVTESMQSRGFRVSIEVVDYEIQRGGNALMKICPGSPMGSTQPD